MTIVLLLGIRGRSELHYVSIRREWLGNGKSGNSLCREKIKITPLLVSAANSTVYCSYCQVKTLHRTHRGVEDIFASLTLSKNVRAWAKKTTSVVFC